jgi:hypothetical protein
MFQGRLSGAVDIYAFFGARSVARRITQKPYGPEIEQEADIVSCHVKKRSVPSFSNGGGAYVDCKLENRGLFHLFETLFSG